MVGPESPQVLARLSSKRLELTPPLVVELHLRKTKHGSAAQPRLVRQLHDTLLLPALAPRSRTRTAAPSQARLDRSIELGQISARVHPSDYRSGTRRCDGFDPPWLCPANPCVGRCVSHSSFGAVRGLNSADFRRASSRSHGLGQESEGRYRR